MDKKKDFSDTRETIQRASEASGARKMLDDLAKKMRGAGNHSERDGVHPKSSICDELIAIVNEPYKGQIIGIPKIYKRKSFETVGGYTLHITIPKKSSIYHHGSDYSIECTEPFRIEGVMTTALKDINIVEKLKGLHCIILEIHHHDMLSIKSSHIHFRCENGYAEQIKDIMRFLRYY
ncbi:MAG: hypothetical protein V1854_04785 [Methanobacteriota archaeon]